MMPTNKLSREILSGYFVCQSYLAWGGNGCTFSTYSPGDGRISNKARLLSTEEVDPEGCGS
jgi:hypothetical protein